MTRHPTSTMRKAARAAAHLTAWQCRTVSAASARSTTHIQVSPATRRPMSIATREGAAKAKATREGAAKAAAIFRSQSSMAADIGEEYSFAPFSKVIPLNHAPAAVPTAAWQAGRQDFPVCVFLVFFAL